MTLLKQPKGISDVVTGMVLFLTNPVLISLPLVFIVTFSTYIDELRFSDFHVTHLINPLQKHPSDQFPDDISTKARKLIVSFVDG